MRDLLYLHCPHLASVGGGKLLAAAAFPEQPLIRWCQSTSYTLLMSLALLPKRERQPESFGGVRPESYGVIHQSSRTPPPRAFGDQNRAARPTSADKASASFISPESTQTSGAEVGNFGETRVCAHRRTLGALGKHDWDWKELVKMMPREDCRS